jgi:hypothetical protein
MAGSAELEIQIIREALEGMVAPEIAAAVLLEALAPYGGELPDPSTLEAFVERELRPALQKRLRGDTDPVIEHVSSLLSKALAASQPPPPKSGWTEATTAQVAIGEGPVSMVVVAGRPSLAMRLRAAVGRHRLAVVAASTAEATQQMLYDAEPTIVLIDATDRPRSEPAAIAQALGKITTDCVAVVWGSRDEYGREIVKLLERTSLRVTPLDEKEGVDPLVDLIRSRSSDET